MNKECKNFFKELKLSINKCIDLSSTNCQKINRFYFIRTNNFINGMTENSMYNIVNQKGIEQKKLKNLLFLYDHTIRYDDIVFGDGSDLTVGLGSGLVIGIDMALYHYYNRIGELNVLKELLEKYLIMTITECDYKGRGMDKYDYINLIKTELCRKLRPQEGYILNHSELIRLVQTISELSYEEYETRVFNETWDFEIMESAVMLLEHIINYNQYGRVSKLGVMDSIIKMNSNTMGYYENIMIQFAREFLSSVTERHLTYVTKDKFNISLINLLKRSGIKSFKNNLNHIPVSEAHSAYLDSVLETEESIASKRLQELFQDQTYIGLVNKANALVESINQGVEPKFIQTKLEEFKLLAGRIKFLSDPVTTENVDKLVEDTVKVINNKYTNGVNIFVI